MASTVSLLQAHGSNRSSFGNTIVISSIHVLPATSHQLQVIFTDSAQDSFYQQLVADTLSAVIMTHMIPISLVRITVQVLNNDGSLLAVALDSVMLSLIDAGIPLSTTLTAVSAIIDKDSRLVLDPTLVEEEVFFANSGRGFVPYDCI
jgi:ribonuclease PH